MRKSDINFVGKTFGWLTVISFSEMRNHRSFWLCRCKCGNTIIKRSDGLHDNSSCIKCKAEKQRIRMTTHNETKNKLYGEWRQMRARCNNPNNAGYLNYGGRGINVSSEWNHSYECFRDYVTKLDNYGKKGYTLDRIDVNGNYEPNNVRWVDNETQANNRRDNYLITFKGKTMSLKQWSRELGVNYTTLQSRKSLGWSDVKILETPVKYYNLTRA